MTSRSYPRQVISTSLNSDRTVALVAPVFVEEHGSEAEDRRPVGVATVSSAAISVATLLVGGMIFRAITYRAIGPSEGGFLALSLAFVTTAGTLVPVGVTSAIVKFVAARRREAEGASYILTGALTIAVQSAIAVVLLGLLMPTIAGWIHTPRIVEMRWAILLGICLVAFQLYWERAFNGLLRHNMAAGMNLTNHGVRILSCLLLIGLGYRSANIGIMAVIVGLAVANAWGITLVANLMRRHHGKIWNLSCARNLYSLGMYQFGSVVLEQIVYNGGIILAARFLTSSAVGLYSSASLLAQSIWLMPAALQTITYPVMSRHWNRGDKNGLGFTINFSMRATLVITAPLVFALFYMRRDIIRLLYGASFAEAAGPLAILLLGYTVNAVVRPIGVTMGAIERPQLDVVRAAISGSVFIALSVLLIPIWGLAGAAWAMTITLTVSSVLVVIFIFHASKVTFSWRPLVTGAAFALMVTMLAALPVTTAGGRLAIALTGAVALAATGWIWGLNSRDRLFLIGKLKRA